jgi:hypothetical protein
MYMIIRRPALTALLLTLLGLSWPGGARADDAGRAGRPLAAPVLKETSGTDIFTDELKKRQLVENKVAICRDFATPGKNIRNADHASSLRDSGTELVFLVPDEPRRDFFPPVGAAASETPCLALPPSRSPPLR